MERYEDIVKNAFEAHDQEFLLGLLRYAPSHEEDEIERLMIELDICPNCCGDLETVNESETHGYTAYEPLVENYRYKKCTVCHWE